MNAFESYFQQRQAAEEFEWKQQRMERNLAEEWHKEERDEDCRSHEEEMHEMRMKESRQQQQISMMLQFAMTGMMSYMGMKFPSNNDDKNHGDS